MSATTDFRPAHLVALGDGNRAVARAQNFSVERIAGQDPVGFASDFEAIVLLPDGAAHLDGDHAADLAGRSIAIVPPGEHRLALPDGGEAYLLTSLRRDISLADTARNAAAYAQPDPRVAAVGEPFQRVADIGQVCVLPISEVQIPPDNGRLRFVQSDTMSINWVEYEGTRSRSELSPHAHDDAEQASLAIEGSFVHHLRTPWGRDADLWREDDHMAAPERTVIVIPPEIIHTTEGVGPGRHVLVDIFAPPRRDFIARGWVHNAADYAAPEAAKPRQGATS